MIKFYKKSVKVNTPRFMTDGAACFDIEAFFEENDKIKIFDTNGISFDISVKNNDGKLHIIIPPYSRVLIPTGLHFALTGENKYSLRLHPRSGLSIKRGLTLINSEGVVDSDYIDEVMVPLWNTTGYSQAIITGERVCQGEIVLQNQVELIEIYELPKKVSNRTGGFGSTGT